MALSDSKAAIGAVSNLLRERLSANTSASSVLVGRPEQAPGGTTGSRLNLFLYQITYDQQMRNQPPERAPGGSLQPPQLWLVLHYLLTAFDSDAESDTVPAHELLGEGLLALHAQPTLHPSVPALVGNPKSLRITFEEADPELLTKLMHGSEGHYRLSAAFQVSPVLVAGGEPPTPAIP
jgi:hypothetical protein